MCRPCQPGRRRLCTVTTAEPLGPAAGAIAALLCRSRLTSPEPRDICLHVTGIRDPPP